MGYDRVKNWIGCFAVAAIGLGGLAAAEETPSAFESARDYVNQLPKMSPGFIEIGEYLPNEMDESMRGIWLEYDSSRTYYVRLKDFTQVELGRTAMGECRLILSGDTPSIGFRWTSDGGWRRDRGQIFLRSADCDTIRSAGEAFQTLIKLDGGRPDIDDNIRPAS